MPSKFGEILLFAEAKPISLMALKDPFFGWKMSGKARSHRESLIICNKFNHLAPLTLGAHYLAACAKAEWFERDGSSSGVAGWIVDKFSLGSFLYVSLFFQYYPQWCIQKSWEIFPYILFHSLFNWKIPIWQVLWDKEWLRSAKMGKKRPKRRAFYGI